MSKNIFISALIVCFAGCRMPCDRYNYILSFEEEVSRTYHGCTIPSREHCLTKTQLYERLGPPEKVIKVADLPYFIQSDSNYTDENIDSQMERIYHIYRSSYNSSDTLNWRESSTFQDLDILFYCFNDGPSTYIGGIFPKRMRFFSPFGFLLDENYIIAPVRIYRPIDKRAK